MWQILFYYICIYFVLFLKLVERLIFFCFPNFTREKVIKEFKSAGIEINGERNWDIQVYDEGFFLSAANEGTLASGEFYMQGKCHIDNIEEHTTRVLNSNMIKNSLYGWNPLNRIYLYVNYNMFNLQTKSLAKKVVDVHYDLGNDIFEAFLDPYMQYSCGYWKNAKTLEEAQLNKMDLIARKLKLKPGMRVLDMGCGWGGLAKYLAENYKVSVVGVNISKEGVKFGQKFCEGLPVEIRLQDYRDVDEKFDRVVNVGFMEHVGEANYKEFFQVAYRCLKDDGLYLVHTIGMNCKLPNVEPWALKYVFPNGMVPKAEHIVKYSEGMFVIEDWHNFGPDYKLTLREWNKRFKSAWPKLQSKDRDEVFFRMFDYYLQVSGFNLLSNFIFAALFRTRTAQLWQIVFSKGISESTYVSER